MRETESEKAKRVGERECKRKGVYVYERVKERVRVRNRGRVKESV